MPFDMGKKVRAAKQRCQRSFYCFVALIALIAIPSRCFRRRSYDGYYTDVNIEALKYPATLAMWCNSRDKKGGWYGHLGAHLLEIYSLALNANSRGLDYGFCNCTHNDLVLPQHGTCEFAKPVLHYVAPKQAIEFYSLEAPLSGYVFPKNAACVRRSEIVPLLSKKKDLSKSPWAAKNVVAIIIENALAPIEYYIGVIESLPGKDITIFAIADTDISERLTHLYPGRISVKAKEKDPTQEAILTAPTLVVTHDGYAWSMALASANLQTLFEFRVLPPALPDHAYDDIDVVRYFYPRPAMGQVDDGAPKAIEKRHFPKLRIPC